MASNVLVIGAGGYVGSAVARALIAAGHTVTGLARSDESAARFRAAGHGAVEGNTTDLPTLAAIADRYDALVFSGVVPFEAETPILTALLDRYEGSGRSLLFTSGTAVLSIETHDGEWRQESFAEDEPFTPPPWIALRVATEDLVRSYATRGVKANVIRPPLIWGNGGSMQIPAIFASVKTTGAACYIGQGLNLYSNVHVDDLAQVYRLALEAGTPGALYHAVAGEADWRSLAEAVAQVMGTATKSVSIAQAREIWGDRIGPLFFGVSSRSKAARTRCELGWVPRHTDVIEDVRSGSYKARYAP